MPGPGAGFQLSQCRFALAGNAAKQIDFPVRLQANLITSPFKHGATKGIFGTHDIGLGIEIGEAGGNGTDHAGPRLLNAGTCLCHRRAFPLGGRQKSIEFGIIKLRPPAGKPGRITAMRNDGLRLWRLPVRRGGRQRRDVLRTQRRQHAPLTAGQAQQAQSQCHRSPANLQRPRIRNDAERRNPHLKGSHPPSVLPKRIMEVHSFH